MSLRSRDDDFDEFEDHDINLGDDGEDAEVTVACPYCGEEIYEDANWCPYCANYLSQEDSPRPRHPWWLVAGVVVCLAIVFSWFLMG